MTKEELELEKLKIKRNREKFWVGTVLIGVISLLLNSSIQNSKIEYERVKQENEHLSKFVTYAIDKDIEVRRDIAEYFATISYSQEARERWENYLASIDTLVELKYYLITGIEINRDNRDRLLNQLAEAKMQLINNPNNEGIKTKIADLEFELQNAKEVIIEKSQELQNIQKTSFSMTTNQTEGTNIIGDETMPGWYAIALGELNKGIEEFSGDRHNPEILKYWENVQSFDNTDELPWNAVFVNWCLNQGHIKGTDKENARSFDNWGVELETPRIGCIVVFWRESIQSSKGHVGFYAGDDGERVLTLGGNQGNRVAISSYRKNTVVSYRWPNL